MNHSFNDQHWNLFVIFPKEDNIELIDLLDLTDVSIKLLQELWNQIWMYYRIMGYPLESECRFVYSRNSINEQEDSYNNGIFMIMYMSTTMYHVDPNQCTDEVCNGMQIHLHNYFLDKRNGGLLTNWKSTTKSTYPTKPKSATVIQPSQKSPSKDINNNIKKESKAGK